MLRVKTHFLEGVKSHTFSLPHRQQTVFVAVAERPFCYRLKVPGVNSAAGNRVAALTHAGVVAQTAFVQVRVGERVAAGNPFSLDTNGGKTKTELLKMFSGHHKRRSSRLDSPGRRPACDRADAQPRGWRRLTACRALTAMAVEHKQMMMNFRNKTSEPQNHQAMLNEHNLQLLSLPESQQKKRKK